jgi:hypothetical protein
MLALLAERLGEDEPLELDDEYEQLPLELALGFLTAASIAQAAVRSD